MASWWQAWRGVASHWLCRSPSADLFCHFVVCWGDNKMLVSSWWQNYVLCTKCGRKFWPSAIIAWLDGGGGGRMSYAFIWIKNVLPLLVQHAQLWWEPVCSTPRAFWVWFCEKYCSELSGKSELARSLARLRGDVLVYLWGVKAFPRGGSRQLTY